MDNNAEQRIMIDIKDGIEVHHAIDMVRAVIRQGKISEQAGIKQYCFVTRFEGDLLVYARRKRKGQLSDSFVVEKDHMKK